MTEEERQILATLKGLGPTTQNCLGTVLAGFDALQDELSPLEKVRMDMLPDPEEEA